MLLCNFNLKSSTNIYVTANKTSCALIKFPKPSHLIRERALLFHYSAAKLPQLVSCTSEKDWIVPVYLSWDTNPTNPLSTYCLYSSSALHTVSKNAGGYISRWHNGLTFRISDFRLSEWPLCCMKVFLVLLILLPWNFTSNKGIVLCLFYNLLLVSHTKFPGELYQILFLVKIDKLLLYISI